MMIWFCLNRENVRLKEEIEKLQKVLKDRLTVNSQASSQDTNNDDSQEELQATTSKSKAKKKKMKKKKNFIDL